MNVTPVDSAGLAELRQLRRFSGHVGSLTYSVGTLIWLRFETFDPEYRQLALLVLHTTQVLSSLFTTDVITHSSVPLLGSKPLPTNSLSRSLTPAHSHDVPNAGSRTPRALR